MRKYFGWEFKPALTAAIHKMAADLGIQDVNVRFVKSIPTAAINRHGEMMITNIRDDAVLTGADLSKFTGFALHELLHRKWTDFDAMDSGVSPYLFALHNGIEDAWIENMAVAKSLTGNVTGLLTTLIDTMATSALADVKDWADPRQYPFALAVYARKHGQVVIPLAQGLRPIFDEACRRLESAGNTRDTWVIAQWVYKQIQNLDDNPAGPTDDPATDPTDGPADGPSDPSDGPTSPDEGEGEGDPQGEADKPVGKATNPSKKGKREDVKPRSTEPYVDLPPGAASGGSTSAAEIRDQGYHVRIRQWRITI